MPTVSLDRIWLNNLAGCIDPFSKLFVTREVALERLRQMTGQDFGYDVKKWKAYLRAYREKLNVSLSDGV